MRSALPANAPARAEMPDTGQYWLASARLIEREAAKP
jgi:hypothetical protein